MWKWKSSNELTSENVLESKLNIARIEGRGLDE
jgi:hypothetical protein